MQLPLQRQPERHIVGKIMTQDAKSAATGRKKSTPAASKSDGQLSAAYQQYQAAVQLLQQGKYDRALAAFEKLQPEAPPEIKERCKIYIVTCQRQLEKPSLNFASPEEHFDFAVAQLNNGYYEEAREHFNNILAQVPDADYVFYGLALLNAVTGQSQECLTHLAHAIELNPRNRLQARVDNDFQSMVDDPRFTELLYPEVP
jgi:tetratricopeptide (TPR) repeat protein